MNVKIKDIAIINREHFDLSKHSNVLYLDITNVVTGKIINLQKYDVVNDDIPSRAQRAVKSGTILISTVRPSLKHYCYLDNPEDNMVVSSGFVTIDAKDDIVDSRYLYYILSSNFTTKYLSQISSTAVSSYPSFNPIDIENFKINIFNSIEEQKKIVSILTNIDSKINTNNAIISQLDAMAKQIYDYWFVQFDFPDENGRPYKSSGGKMVWNEKLKREIPEGWEVKRVGDIISTERGISYGTSNIKTGEGVSMLNLATFTPGGGNYKADGLKHYLGDYPENKVLKPYDLIMCNTQQTSIKFETDIIGRAMLVPDIFDGDIVFSHHVNVIRTTDENIKYYLLYLFNSEYYHKYISGFTNGTNILSLSFNGVEDYLTESPSADILKVFGEQVIGVEKKKSEIFFENQQLASLRDFLLPLLMNGQVKIRDVEHTP